ncbi:MAG: hypothetical protein IPP49_01560 [Saprospiraceae bacterium]|nr:hypothetical protein [Saprospiraceae bacterium]
MMRAFSALGNIKKALEFAKEALKQAPDDINKKNLENAIKTLRAVKHSDGKLIIQNSFVLRL